MYFSLSHGTLDAVADLIRFDMFQPRRGRTHQPSQRLHRTDPRVAARLVKTVIQPKRKAVYKDESMVGCG